MDRRLARLGVVAFAFAVVFALAVLVAVAVALAETIVGAKVANTILRDQAKRGVTSMFLRKRSREPRIPWLRRNS